MVLRNSITKSAGNMYDKISRPKKMVFDVGEYDVSFHTQEKQIIDRPWQYYHCAIWHRKKLIGGIDLSTAYSDVQTVVSVNANIVETYQGLGIAYRVYEGLTYIMNISLQSSNQSKGAVKLWRKLAANRSLRVYFIDDVHKDYLFQCDMHDIYLNEKGNLEGRDYTGFVFDPYIRNGSLILVKHKGALDKSIQQYILLRQGQYALASSFKRLDIIRYNE